MCSIVSSIFQALAVYSPYFEQFFYGANTEAASGHYEIIEPKAEALVTLISIAASCDFKKINKENGINYIFRSRKTILAGF